MWPVEVLVFTSNFGSKDRCVTTTRSCPLGLMRMTKYLAETWII